MQASFLDPCKVKILIIADGESLTFTEAASFSLCLLVEHLRETSNSFVKFDVKTAFRGSRFVSADSHNYLFDNLEGFDEIWLFGQESYGDDSEHRLPDSMLINVIKFMEDGQGVFATGDHADLGAALNGRVPRVRSMRKWFTSPRNPSERPEAPSRDLSDRRDTLQKGRNNLYESVDQSDDIPQVIEPILYQTPCSPVYGIKTYPHPLLCGSRGIIKVLPDHMHEGECIIPDNLDLSLIERTGIEYPLISEGVRPSPQIVAWSGALEAHTTQGDDNERHPFEIFEPVQPTKFGAICAYDGHLLKVGRVVVQSSFHHFLFLNLKGFENSHTDEGRFAYEDIKSYYRNIAIWIASPKKQRKMFLSALWLTRFSSRIKSKLPMGQIEGSTISVKKIFEIGAVARRVHIRLTSNCLTLGWVVGLIDDLFIKKKLPHFLNPWLKLDPKPLLSSPLPPSRPIDTELMVDAVLGGIILEIAKKFKSEKDAESENSETILEIEKSMDEAITEGLLVGIKAYSDSLKQTHEFIENIIRDS
jgi:hypothetical protein